jgi:hypothetical protein
MREAPFRATVSLAGEGKDRRELHRPSLESIVRKQIRPPAIEEMDGREAKAFGFCKANCIATLECLSAVNQGNSKNSFYSSKVHLPGLRSRKSTIRIEMQIRI